MVLGIGVTMRSISSHCTTGSDLLVLFAPLQKSGPWKIETVLANDDPVTDSPLLPVSGSEVPSAVISVWFFARNAVLEIVAADHGDAR